MANQPETKSPSLRQLLVALLAGGRPSLSLVQEVALLIAADAKFNSVFGRAKGVAPTELLERSLEVDDDALRQAQAALETFDSNGSQAELEKALAEVRRTIDDCIGQLSSARRLR